MHGKVHVRVSGRKSTCIGLDQFAGADLLMPDPQVSLSSLDFHVSCETARTL